MQLSDVICVSEDVVSREVSGEMVLLDMASGTYFGLNAVGTRIWSLLDEKAHSIAALCEIIEAEFDAPLASIQQDVLGLATELSEQNLISVE